MTQNNYGQYLEAAAIALLGEPREKRGDEWRYGRHGSLAIDTGEGHWYDHEAEEGGGTLDLIIREAGRATVAAAISWLEEHGIKPREEPERPAVKPRVVQTYDYVDDTGELLFQVCRMEPKTFRQRRPKDDGGWSWSVKGVRQVPYRLPDMLAKPQATVFIVEGEKDADRLAALGLVATCNAGGAGKWPDELTPWFKGRKVVLLPDADRAGQDHAQQIAAKLHGTAALVRVVELPGLPEKGDVSDWLDSGGTREALVEMCKAAPEWQPAAPDPKPEPLGPKHPFKCLGFDDGHYYYLPRTTQQIVAIPAGGHTNKSYLLTVAPLEWYELTFPGEKSGADWTRATNAMIRWSEQVGTFDPAMVRGRGAWFDEGRSVLHLGDRLLVGGQEIDLIDFRTRYIYERKPALEVLRPSGDLQDAQAAALRMITDRLNWQKPVNGLLLAGWVVLAPICGALSWRPHIWLTGQRGTGKSWVFDNIIAPAVGGSALIVQSNSTEAGIRQRAGHDARPVIFDEAEGESQQARHRMQAVLELARQASSDSLAEIAKGTAGGKALTYRTRAMFIMGSINVGLAQASDKSRFSVLSLTKGAHGAEGRQQFEALESMVNSTLTEDYCAALRARTYRLIPVIRDNARVLSKAAAEHIGNQRAGDQIGALLAGALTLGSSERIGYEQALAWVASQEWGVDGDDENDSDEKALVEQLMHAQIRFDTHSGPRTRSVSELILSVSGVEVQSDYADQDAHQALARHGIKYAHQTVSVSESHPEIKKMLKETPWAGGWARILERIPGAEKVGVMRFSGMRHRAVRLPVGEIL